MKVLVVGPSWIGDMMMAQSLYKTIKKENYDAIIDVLAPDWCKSLLTRMPEVNQSIKMPIGHGELEIKKRYFFGKILKKKLYDRAYILPNSFKSALIPFFAGIKHRIGWRGEMRYGLLNDIRILKKDLFPLMVQRYIALGYDQPIASSKELPQPLLFPCIRISESEKNVTMQKFALSRYRPIIGLCPGIGSNLAKCWPYYHYATLAEKLISSGYQIILLGSKKDLNIGNMINQLIFQKNNIHCKNLIGSTTLDEAVILLSICNAIISNDSGLMHIAAALNQYLITLYGPSNPNFTPPLSNKARIIHDNNFNGILKKYNCYNKYHNSMINIQPLYVYDQLINLLK